MLHFLFLSLFCIAVGLVLGAMLRASLGAAVRLGLWIAAGMTGAALAVAWLMYFIAT